jgi:hypothetical protein
VADVLAARGVSFVFSTGYSGLDMREHAEHGERDRVLDRFSCAAE